MKDDRTRVLVSDWNTKISKYVTYESDKQDYTPKFGYIIDYLRNHYEIYVCAVPVTNSDLDRNDSGDPKHVYNFRGETTWIKQSILFKSEVCTNISYYGAIRTAINNAITFLDQNQG